VKKAVRRRGTPVSECQSKQQCTRQKASSVIPVEKFKSPPLVDLLCIRPTAPTEHAEQHEN
jgi:hypothetical protein